MTNLEIPLGGFEIFPWFRTRSEDFDFRQDFGRRTGKKLIRSLDKMFQIPIALSPENIIYTIPIEKTLFPKRKQPQDQIDLCKAKLDASIKARLNRFGDVKETTHTDIIISGIVEDLALYQLAFGEFPLPEEVKAKILKSIKLNIEWHESPSPTIASMHLILGGEPLWKDQQSSDMLEDLGDILIEELHTYQYTHAFNNGFARTALAYKALRDSS